ncbi:MAG TPA: LacI family DNA-binding transcriptional regulator, partial [bacterium]|nr:LacI family DNA-binding transcriptional regulator [bacterium]
ILKGAMQQATEEGVEIEFIDRRLLLDVLRKEPVLAMHGTFRLNFKEEELQKRNYNLIILHSPGPLKYFHTVRHNLHKAAYYATKHLISRGHKRIGLIVGFLSSEGWLPRFEGYLQALKEGNLPLNLKMVKETSGYDRNEDIIAFEELLALKDLPTAICTGNDERALNILDYCCKKGIRVPEDMAICGIDNIYKTEFSRPPLTTVDTGWEEIGKAAINFVLELMEKPGTEIQDIVVEPELIIRKST